MSGLKGFDVAEKQIQFLTHKYKLVRYWAGLGLMSQHKEVLKKYQVELSNALNDNYQPVQITIAAILYKKFGSKKALEILKNYSKSKNWPLSLMAINHMLYFKKKAVFTPTIEEIIKRPKLNGHVKNACLDFLQSEKLKNTI